MKKYKNVLTTVVFLLLIAVTIFVIARQSSTFTLQDFWAFIREADPKWMLPALACVVAYVTCEGLALLVVCNCLGYRRPFHKGIVYSSADIYFSAVTPSATGGQPASAYFMMRDGIPSLIATVVLLINLALYTASIVLLTLGLTLVWPDAFLAFTVPSKILIIIGAFFQTALFVGLLMLLYRERLLMRILDFISGILHRLHLAGHADERKAKLEKMKEDYDVCARTLSGHRRKLVYAFVLNFMQRLCNMLVPAFVYMASGGQRSMLPRVLATQSLVVVGSNAIPMPGAVGVADMLFLDGYSSITEECVNLELLSRGLSFYISVLICAMITLAAFVLHKKHRRKDP